MPKGMEATPQTPSGPSPDRAVGAGGPESKGSVRLAQGFDSGRPAHRELPDDFATMRAVWTFLCYKPDNSFRLQLFGPYIGRIR